MMMAAKHELDRLLYSRKEAAYLLSLSSRSLDYLIEKRHIKARRIGSRVLIPVEEVRRIAVEGVECSVIEAA